MNQTEPYHDVIIRAVALAVGVVLFVIFGTTIYRRYLGISRGPAALLLLLASAAGIGSGLYFADQLNSVARNGQQPEWRSILISFTRNGQIPEWRWLLIVVLAALLPAVLVPFLARLYLKWICGQLTEAEKNPGVDGVRAWLRGGNLACALFLSVCAWQLFGYSFWGVLALTLMALLAFPVLNMASTSSQPTQPMETKTENLSSERERVLKMLDDGKITAQESAELLSALSISDKTSQQPKSLPVSRHRKLVMVGLALLLIGFFLPWFSVNIGNEMNRAMGQMQQSFNGVMPQNSGMEFSMPSMNMKTGSISVAAGDIAHGLGWWILILGLVAGVLPFFATTLEASMQKKIVLAALGIGSILLIYVLSDSIRYVSFGILLAMAGYVLEVIGTLKDRQTVST